MQLRIGTLNLKCSLCAYKRDVLQNSRLYSKLQFYSSKIEDFSNFSHNGYIGQNLFSKNFCCKSFQHGNSISSSYNYLFFIQYFFKWSLGPSYEFRAEKCSFKLILIQESILMSALDIKSLHAGTQITWLFCMLNFSQATAIRIVQHWTMNKTKNNF